LGIILTAFTSNETSELTTEEFDKIISKAENYLFKSPCTLNYKMASFKNYTEKNAHDTQKGKVMVNGDYYFSDFLGIKTIQNKEYRLVIDTVDKQIMINEPIKVREYKPLMENFKVLKSLVKSFHKTDYSDYSAITLNFKEKKKVNRIVIEVNADGFIRKTSTFFNVVAKPDQQNNSNEKPRIETDFFGYKKIDPKKYNSVFDSKSYVQKLKNGFTGIGKYKNYKVIDSRI
jgi:hypothetical protein